MKLTNDVNKEDSILKSLSIDCVVFSFSDRKLEVLIVQHAKGFNKGNWGLPGGWIMKNEDIDDAAARLLSKLTGINNIYLEQLKAFGKADRFGPSRVITLGYYALIQKTDFTLKAGFTASKVQWLPVGNIPTLIYDHNEILDFSIGHLQNRVRHEPIGFNLLPEKFTLLELMNLYSQILRIEMDKSNFRRKFLKMKLLVPLDEKQTEVSHRAAKLYKFDPEIYHKLTKKGFNFEF